MTPALREQAARSAPPTTKIRLALLSTALVDALGGPAEFHIRGRFPLVTDMLPNDNFRLPPGVWTDDTSMTLCLARSIATHRTEGAAAHPEFSELHQLSLYAHWWKRGYLSSIGRCFDIGANIRRALTIFLSHPSSPDTGLAEIQRRLSGEKCLGNGSLMRVLPIGLAYWRDDAEAQTLARRSSTTTHPAEMCQEACALWASLIARIVRDTASGASLSKLDLLHLVSEYPYADDRLRASLSLPADSLPCPTLPIPRETHYWAYHPILQLVANTSAKAAAAARNRTKPSGRNLLHYFPSSSTRGSKANLSAPSSTNQPAPIDTSRRTPASTSESTSPTAPAIPSAVSLPSTGFVLDTLRAALYCFFATDTFESGAVMAVNLGDDADTVGAVYGGLAGVWYGVDDGEDERTSSEGLFWSSRVREWVAALRARELIDEVASELVNFVEAQYPNTVFDER